MRRSLALLFSLVPAAVLASSTVELTQDEFKMFRHWQKAMQDPRVEKMPPAKRNPAIAKDARFNLKQMEAAIAKGEAAGDLQAACNAAIKESLSAVMGDRIGTVDVDLSEPHGVGYIQWNNDNLSQLEEEASVVAAHTAKSCPILSTIQVWAMDKANPKTRVFQALISQEAAARINIERAKDFADTRYIRLFEKVKNLANGDTFEPADTNTAGANTGNAGQP